MKARFLTACAALIFAGLAVGSFVGLWRQAVTAPDDAVREICIGTSEFPDWYLAEKQVEGARYYTVYSRRGNTPWDMRFGNRPGGWLFGGAMPNAAFMLQRTDGRTWTLDFATGAVEETSLPDYPLPPLRSLFADSPAEGE